MKRNWLIFLALTTLVLLLFLIDLLSGSAAISLSDVLKALSGGDVPDSVGTVVLNIRLLKALAALLAGAALSVSGLQMQTLFRNPLAGPYVLGVSSGASLGVALFILGIPFLSPSIGQVVSSLGMAGAAWAGAALVLALVASLGRRIKDIMVILILGMMLSCGVDAFVQVLQYVSNEQALKAFVLWTMGSLANVTYPQIIVLSVALAFGLMLSVISCKSLNMLLLGEDYARSMGMNVRSSRNVLFLSTVLLSGSVTAFCGPVGFIGLAVPHVARALMRSADHRLLIPSSALLGSAALLFCDIVSKQFALPINSITSLLGIPLVLWIVLKHKSI